MGRVGEPPADNAASGLRNLRYVGVIRAAGGRQVARGRLYRSDAPIVGDPEPELRPWPPRAVVDLRSPGEARSDDHPLASEQTRIVNIPLFRQLEPGRPAGVDATDPPGLPAIYRRLMRASAVNLVAVVRVIADSPSPVLVHCAAGKDRTGVVTAVALAAVGASPDAIVADYLRTEASLDGLLERLALGWSDEHRDARVQRLTLQRPDLMLAPAAAIEAVLETLHAWPGATPGWLLEHGLEESELGALVERLTVAAAV
jgi:hypothetical protein